MIPPEAPHLTLPDRLVASRPQGLARRLARVSVVALLVTFAASVLLTFLFPEHRQMPRWLSLAMGFSYLGTLLLYALAAAVQLWCWIAPRVRATVEASADALSLRRRSRRRVPLESIAAGWLLRTADRGEVELELRSGEVLSVEVRDPQEADALLDAANVAPHERALTMRLGGPVLDLGLTAAAFLPSGCFASIAAVLLERLLHLPSATTGFIIFTLTALLVALAVTRLRPPLVRVGRDGVSARGGRGAWFAPWSEVTAVTRRPGSLSLSLRGGGSRDLPLVGTSRARQDALCERIAGAHEEARAPRDLPARLAALDRQGRTIEAWREALRAIASSRDDYRETGLSRDELLAALSDPHAPEERRVAAAFVLSNVDPAAAAARVRVAVETVAHDPVRIALTRAAEGSLDDDTLRQAAETRVRAG